MDLDQQRAVLKLCLMAAFADGVNSDQERAELKRIAGALGSDSALDAAAIYEDVLLEKPEMRMVAAAITQPEQRQFAYEMAVGVCNADGATTPAERTFLDELASALNVDRKSAQQFAQQANALAAPQLAGPALDGPIVAAVPADAAALDATILNYAIVNGALELLPQSLASMAIIPLQMKMVYAIGKAYGYQLDREHIKELLATLGVGLTSQFLEQLGRRLIGGVLGRIGGGLLGGAGSVPPVPRSRSPRPMRLARSPNAITPGGARSMRQASSRLSRKCWNRQSSCRASTRARSPSRRARSI